ncbi:AP-3 complex subunit delta [Ceratobasidium sp. 428]|nr:AP-3 complex subunit delta [Ceratobasidium sp. 428]
MLGYPMRWASFYVVEVMSSPKFHLKAVGYLAAVQSFTSDTDVLMLTTNLLKKDLSSAAPASLPVALNGFSHLATADLSRDLASDIFSLLSHSRPAVRKSAVLALFRILVTYPDAQSIGVERLKERLADDDPGVVSATVNVLCELARISPTDYLVLAPQLFHLLTTASNNWMLIKIVKLFGFLTPHEPRLAKKLTGPLSDLIANTPAITLLYERVHQVIMGGMLHRGMARACSAKLAVLLGDSDQNSCRPPCQALHPTIPVSVLSFASISKCNYCSFYHDYPHSESSQTRAYRMAVARRILHMFTRDAYSAVPDFEWALSVLVDLAYVICGSSTGSSTTSSTTTFPPHYNTTSTTAPDIDGEIASLFRDIAVRVRVIRPFAVALEQHQDTDGDL